MREILRRQIEQHTAVFNKPMPAHEQTTILMRLLVLQGLLFGEATDRFAIASYWESLSGGRLHVTSDLTDRLDKARKAGSASCDVSGTSLVGAPASALKEIEEQGFTVMLPPCPAALVADLHQSLMRLQACGWPAPFLLVYDEAWLLVDGIWGLYAGLLGKDCRLEADLNVWALLTPEQVRSTQLIFLNVLPKLLGFSRHYNRLIMIMISTVAKCHGCCPPPAGSGRLPPNRHRRPASVHWRQLRGDAS
jgi:hypothetical protein